jgi:hypothetical protein
MTGELVREGAAYHDHEEDEYGVRECYGPDPLVRRVHVKRYSATSFHQLPFDVFFSMLFTHMTKLYPKWRDGKAAN